ncbi:MAG: hypothetical protein ACLQO7_02580 [Candidatus Bathyarchaeia archaeon]
MAVEGFAEYKRREFCKEVKCPVQVKLDGLSEGSPEYEETRKKCNNACLCTTWQFHHWLIEKGYLILISKELKDCEQTVLVNLDKAFLDWADKQVKAGKFKDRNQLIQAAMAKYKSEENK